MELLVLKCNNNFHPFYLMLSSIAFTLTRYMENFKDILYLTKSEEGPEYTLDT